MMMGVTATTTQTKSDVQLGRRGQCYTRRISRKNNGICSMSRGSLQNKRENRTAKRLSLVQFRAPSITLASSYLYACTQKTQ